MFHKKTNTTNEKQNSSFPFIFGFLSGIVAGVLFAPTNGSETRTNLKKSIKSLVNNLESSELGQKVKTNKNIVKATNTISDVVHEAVEIRKKVETKATSIANSPVTKKVLTTSLSDIKPTLAKKTGKKFISKKK